MLLSIGKYKTNIYIIHLFNAKTDTSQHRAADHEPGIDITFYIEISCRLPFQHHLLLASTFR